MNLAPRMIILATLLFAAPSVSATSLAPDFTNPYPRSELSGLLGRVSSKVACPRQREYYEIEDAARAALQRSVRVDTTASSDRYRDPRVLGALLLYARDVALNKCPIVIYDPYKPPAELSDGGAIDIFIGGQHVVQVSGYTHRSFGTVYDLAPEPPPPPTPSEYTSPLVEPADASPPSESEAMPPKATEIEEGDKPKPAPEVWKSAESTYDPGPANTPQWNYASDDARSDGLNRLFKLTVGVIFLVLIIGVIRAILGLLGAIWEAITSSPTRDFVEDLTDRAVYEGGRMDIATLKSALHDRPSDPYELAERNERLATATSRLWSHEAQLSAEVERIMQAAAYDADQQARSSRTYDLNSAEMELLRAAVAQQIAAARMEAAKKGTKR